MDDYTLTPEGERAAGGLAERHGVSRDAVLTLLRAMKAGHGRQAQFSHPELGGMGQWSRGGMLMVGDMFNAGLKARVAALCEDVAALVDQSVFVETAALSASPSGRGRWPADLGEPSSSGSQNDMHYAVFPAARRLAVERDGKVTVYDMQDHQISGFGQQQGAGQSLSFTSQNGAVRLEDLAVVGEAGKPISGSGASATGGGPKAPQGAKGDIFAKIEGLSDLHARGILTREEFDAKKAELLSRL